MNLYTQLAEKYKVKPIFRCPGRYIIQGCSGNTPESLYSRGVFTVYPKASGDPVWVCPFSDSSGGIISYEKKDGTFVHTLNTQEGFERKLTNLQIRL